MDGRADQYELAATAYHLLTGAFLYPYSNPAVVIGQHLTAQPPSLADTRPELAPLDAVLRKALAKNPADRFGSYTEFARALANATAMPPPTYPTFPLPAPAPAPTRWPSMLAAAALVVALCVVAYVAIKVINRPEAAPQQFALTGTVHLPGDNLTTAGLPTASVVPAPRTLAM